MSARKKSRPWDMGGHSVGISRADLAQNCLREIRLWPGCETVEEVGVLADSRGRFSIHVISYGAAKKKLADQAARCVQRERLRKYHLRIE
jgi:hypothetical protein